MPIFFLELKKQFRLISTYIFLLLTLVYTLIFAILIPLVFQASNLVEITDDLISNYKSVAINSITGAIISIAVVGTIFISYKTIGIYREEVKSGNFLLLISKPVSRLRIIIEKWLAIFLVTFLYLIIVVIFYDISAAIADPGRNIVDLSTTKLSTEVIAIGAIIIFSIFLYLITISSIILLISTKLNSIGTRGISIAFSIVGLSIIPPTLNNFTNNNSIAKISENFSVDKSLTPKGNTINDLNLILNNENLDKLINKIFSESQSTVIELNSNPDSATNFGVYTDGNDSNFYNGFNIAYQLGNINSPSYENIAGVATVFDSANENSINVLAQYSNTLSISEKNIQNINALNKFNKALEIYEKFIETDNYKNANALILRFLQNLFLLDSNLVDDYANNPSEKSALLFFNEINNKLQNSLLLDFLSIQEFIEAPLSTIFVNQNLNQNLNSSNLFFPNQNLKDTILKISNKINLTRDISSVLLSEAFKNLDSIFRISSLIYLKQPATLIFGQSIENYKNSGPDDKLKNERKNIINFVPEIEENTSEKENIENFLKNNQLLNNFQTTNKFYIFNNNLNTNEQNILDNFQQSSFYDNELKTFATFGKILEQANSIQEKKAINQLLSVKSVPKMNTAILISVYIIIALALVPLTLFVIKKQDIR